MFFALLLGLIAADSGSSPPLSYEFTSQYVFRHESNPFWLHSNTAGFLDDSTVFANRLNTHWASSDRTKGVFSFEFGVSPFFKINEDKAKVYLHELFFLGRWNSYVSLSLGRQEAPTRYQGLSSSNGDFMFSKNTSPIPGVVLETDPYLWLWGRKLGVRAAFGEYLLDDQRAVRNTQLHYKALGLRHEFSPFYLEYGLQHAAQWAGDDRPKSFLDYLRVVSARGGGQDALEGEQRNVLGNHLGAYFLRFGYQFSDERLVEFYWNHFFEDGSGREFLNFPDGFYGIYIELKKEPSILEALVFEFIHTKKQSGPLHDTLDEQGNIVILKGRDNYFGNGFYRSGWTYQGRTIGIPLIRPVSADPVITLENNRLYAFHLGATGGFFAKTLNLRYELRSTFSRNFGTFNRPVETPENIYSLGLRLTKEENTSIPFDIFAESGFDIRSQSKDLMGVALGISKRGHWHVF